MEEVCPVCGRGDGRSGSQNRGDGRQIGRGYEVCGGKEPFESLIPLKEVIAMANGFAVKGKRTERESICGFCAA